MKKIVDGNKAVSNVAYLFSEVASIYPITPSSPMASNVDFLSHQDCYNLFHDKVKVIEMQSEAGAAGAMHGSLISGSLSTTFTASQGLLLMIPNMYKMAGEMLPGVIHVASRSLATHALSIFGDHSDVYATRGTGFCILSSSSVQDAQNMAAVAHLSAMKSSLPFLHFFDGFRTSHELNTIELLPSEKLLSLVPWKEVEDFKNRAINVTHPIERGLAENEDIYFQSMEARNLDYQNVSDIVAHYMDEINQIMNTNYQPFQYYGASDAEDIIVAMGSVCDTIRLVVDEEQKKGRKLGMIEVHLYRPFDSKYLVRVLPKTALRIAVLDRTKESGSIGEPLYLDVLSALSSKNLLFHPNLYPSTATTFILLSFISKRHPVNIGLCVSVLTANIVFLIISFNVFCSNSTQFSSFIVGSSGNSTGFIVASLYKDPSHSITSNSLSSKLIDISVSGSLLMISLNTVAVTTVFPCSITSQSIIYSIPNSKSYVVSFTSFSFV